MLSKWQVMLAQVSRANAVEWMGGCLTPAGIAAWCETESSVCSFVTYAVWELFCCLVVSSYTLGDN